MRVLVLTLLTFKKVKLIFGHPVLISSVSIFGLYKITKLCLNFRKSTHNNNIVGISYGFYSIDCVSIITPDLFILIDFYHAKV